MTTSTPLQATLFDDGQMERLYLLSPVDSRVSRFLQQEKDKGRRMTVISGLKCIESSPRSGHMPCWQKMCLASSAWRVALTGYSLTWKRAATPAGRSLYRLRLSAPTTGGTGSGLLPTPASQEPGISAERIVDRHGNVPEHPNQRLYDKHTGRVVQDGLTQFVGLWPTPRHEGFDTGAHRGEPDSLHSAVKMLPTPDSSPEKYRLGGDSQASHSLEAKARRGDWGTPTGMKLSAAWVTRLMGYPDGWMDDLPSDPIGKPASPASRSTSTTA